MLQQHTHSPFKTKPQKKERGAGGGVERTRRKMSLEANLVSM